MGDIKTDREKYNEVVELLDNINQEKDDNYYRNTAKHVYPYIREMLLMELRTGKI